MSNKKIKIGLLIDSLNMNSSLASLVLSIEKNKNIDIILLQNQFTPEKILEKIKTKLSNEGFFRFISISFFTIISKIEHIVTKKIDSKYSIDSKNVTIKKNIFNNTLNLKPIFYKKFFVKYSDEDLHKVESLKLDFILRGNGTGIFKGKILTASKYGLISLHHGDNTWNRGGPPGFWEVYLKKRKSGFIIQICSEKLDDGNVIFRGETATKFSYLKNRVNLQQISYPYIEKIFEYVLINEKLPESDLSDTSKNQLFKTPKFAISLHYFIKILFSILSKAYRRLILGKKQVWNIGYQKNNLQSLDLNKITKINNPKDRFLADPFIFKKDSLSAIFVEDYSFKTKKGAISVILLDQKNNKITKNIIEEDFHLSFPFVFEYNDKIYMIPESRQDKSIRIYECINFPYNWKFSHKIMDDVHAVDSMVFYKKPYWWLLTNICDDESFDFSSRAHLFFAESPLSNEWTPHLKNPVVFSSDYARNGGIILENEKIYRVRQQYGFNQYGEQISVSELITLNPEQFYEKPFLKIKPNFLDNIKGVHHLTSDGNYSVIDFVKEKK